MVSQEQQTRIGEPPTQHFWLDRSRNEEVDPVELRKFSALAEEKLEVKTYTINIIIRTTLFISRKRYYTS